MTQDEKETSATEPSFEDMLAGFQERRSIERGSKLNAEVISVGQEFVFLGLGQGQEGLMNKTELMQDGEVSVVAGDRVDVFVTGYRDGIHHCSLRLDGGPLAERADGQEAALAALDQARVNGDPVEGTVKETNKGGFVVMVMGQRAFCPISHIDVNYVEDPAIYLERTMTFMVTQIKGQRDVVVSRRRLLEREAELKGEQLWQEIEIGQVFEGTVASVQKYGAFVDIGGVQGLLHVSELGYERVEDPASVLQPGQTLRVSVIKLDRASKRISLSLKALMQDPWSDVEGRFAPEQLVPGTVVRIAPFGAFVELDRGIEGLVHISQLGAGKRVSSPREVLREGQQVEVRVLAVDVEAKRISLAMAGAKVAGQTETRDDPSSPHEEPLPHSHYEGSGFGTFGDLLKKSK